MRPFNPSAIAPLLLAWYAKAGRDLPWRHTRDPYRIWLSEIMLQQTGVDTVIPYYQRFLEHFPTVDKLAAACIDEVIALWAGLGYYSRARNLHAAARAVVEGQGGAFPETLEGLQALPGVGRSTAGAILSIAFDRKGPILDGNVRRVLCRLIALKDDPRSASSERLLWGWAEAMTPEDRPHDYAQAIMDLGATVCTPRRPRCFACPLAPLCRGRALGLEGQLPARRVKKPIPQRVQVALLIRRGEAVLVRKRPLQGMLGGLWEFPAGELGEQDSPESAVARLLGTFGLCSPPKPVGVVHHLYSHFRLQVHVFRVDCLGPALVAEGQESRWAGVEELKGMPLHGAHKKILPLLASTP